MKNTAVSTTTFKWRMGNGARVMVELMDDSHIVNTLKMIWNNTAPEHLQVGNFKMYYFDPRTHSTAYLRQAVFALIAEYRRRHPKALESSVEKIEGYMKTGEYLK